MKRIKFALPIIAISSAIAPLITITSCGEITYESIEVTSALSTVYEGSIINRKDITVVGVEKNGKKSQINDWTCESFVDNKYIVTTQDVLNGSVNFEIKYKKLNKTLSISTSAIAKLNFLLPEITLCKNDKFCSENEIFVYISNGLNPHFISPNFFSFAYFEDDVEKPDTIEFKQIGQEPRMVAYIKGTISGSKHEIKVFRKDDTGHTYPLSDETLKINITTDDYSMSVEGEAATVTAIKGSGETNHGIINIPEYIYSYETSQSYPVTNLSAANPVNIDSIIIPSTITSIEENIFNQTPEFKEDENWKLH